jgi:hypothetical protein
VAAIQAEEHILALDMAALSFGAVRYSYIDDKIRTAALVRPAAAPGTRNSTVVAARTDQLWKSITAQCRCGSATQARSRVSSLMRHYAATSTAVRQRSVPLTEFDVASALVVSGINATTAASLRWKPTAATVDSTGAATLSDSLWLRIGERDVSPALVAYIDEYCQAYPGAPAVRAGDPVAAILAAPVNCGNRTGTIQRPKPVACLIIGANDMSAPAALATTWPVQANGTRVTTPTTRHWFTDMQNCGKAP